VKDVAGALAFAGEDVDDETAEDLERQAVELEQAMRALCIDPDDEDAAQAFCAAWMKGRA